MLRSCSSFWVASAWAAAVASATFTRCVPATEFTASAPRLTPRKAMAARASTADVPRVPRRAPAALADRRPAEYIDRHRSRVDARHRDRDRDCGREDACCGEDRVA